MLSAYLAVCVPKFTLRTSPGNNTCVVTDSTAVMDTNIAHDTDENKVLICRQLEIVAELYASPCSLSALGIHVVKIARGPLMPRKLSDVKAKCVLLPLGDPQSKHVLIPLIHSLTH